MRNRWQGGRSHATNRIVADSGSCTTQVWNGRARVYLQGLERGRRIAIPLKGKRLPSGTLHILLHPNGQEAVHYAVDETAVCSAKPCGTEIVGVDKGCTEAYTDSDGERYGEGPGDLPAAESDDCKVKGQRRNQLRALEQKHREAGNTKQADHIARHNLGNRKRDRRQKRPNAQVRDFLCRAAHSVVDRAGTIACEDPTAPMKSAQVMHRDTQRRLGGWARGVMADTPASISRHRGSALVLVNPACTSQIDSRTGLLQRRTYPGSRFRQFQSDPFHNRNASDRDRSAPGSAADAARSGSTMKPCRAPPTGSWKWPNTGWIWRNASWIRNSAEVTRFTQQP